jgi:hypothetical protein
LTPGPSTPAKKMLLNVGCFVVLKFSDDLENIRKKRKTEKPFFLGRVVNFRVSGIPAYEILLYTPFSTVTRRNSNFMHCKYVPEFVNGQYTQSWFPASQTICFFYDLDGCGCIPAKQLDKIKILTSS